MGSGPARSLKFQDTDAAVDRTKIYIARATQGFCLVWPEGDGRMFRAEDVHAHANRGTGLQSTDPGRKWLEQGIDGVERICHYSVKRAGLIEKIALFRCYPADLAGGSGRQDFPNLGAIDKELL